MFDGLKKIAASVGRFGEALIPKGLRPPADEPKLVRLEPDEILGFEESFCCLGRGRLAIANLSGERFLAAELHSDFHLLPPSTGVLQRLRTADAEANSSLLGTLGRIAVERLGLSNDSQPVQLLLLSHDRQLAKRETKALRQLLSAGVHLSEDRLCLLRPLAISEVPDRSVNVASIKLSQDIRVTFLNLSEQAFLFEEVPEHPHRGVSGPLLKEWPDDYDELQHAMNEAFQQIFRASSSRRQTIEKTLKEGGALVVFWPAHPDRKRLIERIIADTVPSLGQQGTSSTIVRLYSDTLC